MAPALSSMPSMPSVSAASTCTSGSPCKRDRAAQQEFGGAAAAPALGPTVTVVSPPDRITQGLRERLAVPRHGTRQCRVHLADLARLAFDLVAEDVCADACVARHLRRGLQALLRRRDQVHARGRRSRIAGFRGFEGAALQALRAPPAGYRWRSAAGCASASAQVVGSGTVGPLAMTSGASPGTSLISSVTTRAGAHRAARRPPLMADRCLRTQFISSMAAPLLSSALLIALLVGQRQAFGRQRQQRRPPPEIRHSTRSSAVSPGAIAKMRCAAARPAVIGHRVGGFDDLDAARCTL